MLGVDYVAAAAAAAAGPHSDTVHAAFAGLPACWLLAGSHDQSCFLAGGFAKAPAMIETNIAITNTVDMRTKPANSMTRMNSRGCLKCLCAASLVKLLTASRLSLIK